MNYLLASAGELHTPLGHVLDKELLDVGIIGTISMQMVTMLCSNCQQATSTSP